jgi:hypothetical protein
MSTPGPYEPCPCGSGKKYKFCCLAKDRTVGTPDPKSPPVANILFEELLRPDAQLDARYPIDPHREKVLREMIAEAKIMSPDADSLLAFIACCFVFSSESSSGDRAERPRRALHFALRNSLHPTNPTSGQEPLPEPN